MTFKQYFKDLNEDRPVNQSRRDVTINRLLNAIGSYADNHLAKSKKAALNVVENLARNSSQFNSHEQFDIALKALEEARGYNQDAVSQTVLDNYAVMIDKHLVNFDANLFIRDALVDTQTLLKNLSPENRTNNVAEINRILESVSGDYLENANRDVLNAFNKQQKDINDALYVTELLDLWDEKPEEEGWQLEGADIRLQMAKNNILAGDFKKARTLTDKAQVRMEDVVWDALGSNYRINLGALNIKQTQIADEFKKSIDSENNGIFKYMAKQPVATTSNLNTISTEDQRNKWDTHIRTVLLDDDVTLNPKLVAAYQNGGLNELWATVRQEAANANMVRVKVTEVNAAGETIEKYVNQPMKVENLVDYQIYEYLDNQNTFRPHYMSTFDEMDGDNRAGAELFWDWMKMYKMLDVGLMDAKTKTVWNPDAWRDAPITGGDQKPKIPGT